MDELVAAAAVASMVVDSNADDNAGQRGSCSTSCADDATMSDVDASADNKENDTSHAVTLNPEDVPSEVLFDPRMPCNTPSPQHLTHTDST